PTPTRVPYATLFRSALPAGLREELGSLQEEHQGLRALIRRLEKEGGVAVYEMAAPCIFWNFNRPEDAAIAHEPVRVRPVAFGRKDRKSTRLNSSHVK